MKMTQATLIAILNRMTTTGGPFDPAALFVGVATAIVDLGQATVQANVTEATGDLAVRVAVDAWGDPHKLSDGRWAADGPACVFRCADSDDACVLSRWFLNSAGTAGTLKAWGNISPPVNMLDEFSTFTIVPRVTVDPDGRWSLEVYFNG